MVLPKKCFLHRQLFFSFRAVTRVPAELQAVSAYQGQLGASSLKVR